jgi:hypothetical protein
MDEHAAMLLVTVFFLTIYVIGIGARPPPRSVFERYGGAIAGRSLTEPRAEGSLACTFPACGAALVSGIAVDASIALLLALFANPRIQCSFR